VDHEIKTLWVEALRSGYYKQGKNVLKDNNRYCCLGVLKHLIEGDFEDFGGQKGLYLDAKVIGLTQSIQMDLADMNDGTESCAAQSFTQIANYIEQHL
jgi:hypothetical protein